MLMRRLIASGVITLLLASSAAAQSAGTWELGTFGRYTDFGAALAMDSKGGGGARLGFFPLSRLELEAAVSLTSTAQPAGPLGDVTYVPIQARLIYNQPVVSFLQLLVGGGYIQNAYESDGEWYGDSGITGLLGLRLGLGHTLALRLAGTADYLPVYAGDASTTGDATSLGFEAGISVLLGGVSHRGAAEVFPEPQAWTPQQEPAPSDAAGIRDDADRCPGSAVDAAVGADGCPLPQEEEEAAPGEAEEDPAPKPEEALPEPDADADGIPDRLDRCPDTAGGEEIDLEGCTVRRSSDAEARADSESRCDGSWPELRVDSAGCPVLFEEGVTRVTLDGVRFKPGTWDLTSDARAILDGVAQTLLAYPSLRIEIAGYTDGAGSQRRNVWLSQTRADAVKLYLKQQGVPRERMLARGYGAADPVAGSDTAAARARNPRIELRKLE